MEETAKIDRRKAKRRAKITALLNAWSLGEWAAGLDRPYRNPYPPGRRHDAYKRGYEG